jgi:hypothetical protein
MIDESIQAALTGREEPVPAQHQARLRGAQIVSEALINWLRGAYGVGALAPDAVREQLTPAQAAYAEMIRATLANDQSGAMQHRNAWITHAAAAIDLNRQRLDEYQAAFASNAPLHEKMGAVADVAMNWKDHAIAQLASDPNHFTTFGKLYDQFAEQQAQLETATAHLDEIIRRIEQQLGGAAALPPLDAGGGGDLPA